MLTPIENTWEKILLYLQGILAKQSLDRFKALAAPFQLNEEKFIISVPDDYSKALILDKYSHLVKNGLIEIFGTDFAFEIAVIPENEPQIKPSSRETREKPANLKHLGPNTSASYLNPKYTFENFVVGPSNRFAHAAAFAVAEAPAKAYNPLFIYGGVGLGKTHLLQAIGHKVLEKNQGLKVVYVSSEKFTNDFIDSVRAGKMQEFRNRYRHSDILLLDDIQFLIGKEQTQVEFFYTFNTLYEDSKQIVITSDTSPHEIAGLEDRLRSRFEWGLITDIQPPELEVRMAILKKRVERDLLNIPDEVLYYIAANIPSNIRKLEGALTSMVAHSSVMKNPPSVEFAEKVLKDFFTPKTNKTITINLVKKTVADFYSLRIEDLSAKIRTHEIVLARQIAMYLTRELTNSSLPKIGENFGGRDHSTVLHAYDKIKDLINQETEMAETIKNLTHKILNG